MLEAGSAFPSPPHARGWTIALIAILFTVLLSPARAGMDPNRAHDFV